MLAKGLKIFAAVLIVTVIIAGIFVIKNMAKKNSNPLSIASDSTEIIVRVNNPAIFFQNLYTNSKYQLFNSFFEDSALLQQQFAIDFYPKCKELYMLYQPSDGFVVMLTFETKQNAETELLDFAKKVDKKAKTETKKKSGYTLHHFKSGNSKQLTAAESCGLIFIAPSEETCLKYAETAKQKSTENPADLALKNANLASAETLINLFINLKNNKNTTFPHFSDTGWAIFDVDIKENNVVINGLSAGEQPCGYLQAIVENTPQPFSAENIIPAISTEFYNTVYTGKLPLQQQETFNKFKIYFKEKFGTDATEVVENLYGGEIVKFTLPNNHKIVALKAKGESTAEHTLGNLAEYTKKQSNETSHYSFDNQTKIMIYNLPFKNLTGEFFGSAFSLNSKYIAVSDYLFFADNLDALKIVLDNNILQQNMQSSIEYGALKKHQASSANIILYQKSSAPNDLKAFFLTREPLTQLNKHLAKFDNTMLWQISTEVKQPYHNIVLNLGQNQPQYSSIFDWKSRLAETSVMKPAVVKNTKTGENEIMVQDSLFNLYLLNKQGRILWKTQLDSLIISDIYQIDKNKEEQLQYLFNTAGKIYLLNEHGQPLANYPATLKTQASTGLALFDYEKNKDYRMVITHTDHTVSMLDINLNHIEGWNFTKTDALVTTPFQHFKIGNKDFILAGDTIRTYILDRRGEHRVKPSELLGKSQLNPFYYSTARGRWFTTTNKGLLMSISLEGNVRKEKLFEISANHFYLYADLLNDGKGNHIFTDDSVLMVADNQGKLLFKHNFKHNIIDKPSLYIFSAKKRGLGVVDRQDNKVFLFDKNGKQLNGFPQHGVTPFTITHYTAGEQFYHLIVGHIDGNIYDIKIE